MDDLAGLRGPASIGMLALLLAWESIHPFFEQFKGVRARAGHALLNIGLGVFNALVVRFVFLAVWIQTMQWAAAHGFGALHWVTAPAWLEWAMAIVLLDAWTYLWHWMNHAIPFFWRFHRLHHSDRAMDVTTANRFHTVEIAFSSALRIPVLALLGASIEQLAVYEILLFVVVQFHHANIGLPRWLDRALRCVIVTPDMHKVHHSVIREEANSNYSSLFSWWDRLFRTLRLVREPRRITFGVDDEG